MSKTDSKENKNKKGVTKVPSKGVTKVPSKGVTKVPSKGVTKVSSTDSKSSQSSQSSQKSQGSQSSFKSVGMGPSLRMTSTDVRELTKESQQVNISTGGLTAEGGAPPGESVYDTIAYIIFCPEHQKVAISRADKNITWLPFIYAPPNRTWKDASVDGVSIIFNKQDAELDAKLGTKIPTKEMHCLHVFRTQIPRQNGKFICSVIQLVVLDKDPKLFKCCQNTKRIRWSPLKDAMSGNVENVWGPEVQEFSKCAKDIKPTGLTEHSLEKAFCYLTKGDPKSPEEQLIKGIGLGEAEVEKLYDDYIEHCFPSISMSFDSFKAYTTKYLDNYEKNDPRFPMLYSGFNYGKGNSLNFHEFLLGLASMEPKAPHGESRVRFIFRYYDVDSDGKLNETEFKKFIKDINVGSDESKISEKVKEALQQMGAQNGVDFDTFHKAVINKTLKGTSGLCRSPKSVFSQISQTTTTREEKKSAVKKKAGFLLQNRRNKGTCFACRGKKYDYGLHCIKLDTIGRCVEPRRIFEPEGLSDKMTPQKYSIDYTFNTRSIAHLFIDLIRDFSRKKGQTKESKGFMAGDRETLYSYLKVLGNDLESFFVSEDRLIKVNSPAYVFGDIFGNLDDLLTFEKLLWQPFPIISGHYVFLGNYVDKGMWGVECAIYLLALKLISPMKMIILRGNHETRDVQIKDNFQKECIAKYGDKDGPKIWEILNSIFDKMPICAIIDESIFCGHSGVPTSASKVEDVNKVSPDLSNPEKNSITSEILYNEPKEGDVRKFLKTFGLSHMIRSNTVPKEGYSIQFGGKCLTIFSSSNFSGNNNEAVTAFVDTDRIRIIRLDTKQKPKSDPKTETLPKK